MLLKAKQKVNVKLPNGDFAVLQPGDELELPDKYASNPELEVCEAAKKPTFVKKVAKEVFKKKVK